MSSQREEYYTSNNDRSSIARGHSFQTKSPKKKNELASLYEQLRETNTKLKEGPSQGNSVLLNEINESMEKGHSAGNLSRIKEEEIRRMRNEKLEKIRSENQKTSPRGYENRELSAIQTNFLTNNTALYSAQRDASPQFFTEKTMDNRTARSRLAQETFYNADKEENETGLDENNIDIARDYLFYSGNKYDMQPQSVPQPEYSLYNEAEKYPQARFFKRQKEKERTEKLLQEQVLDEIKKMANKSKMSQNSYKIMIRKLESSLSSVLMEVDKAGRKLITFEQLGRIFTLLDIFRIIQYDENCNLENEEQFFSGNVQDQKRRYQEMVIHEEIWKLLAGDEETEYIETEFLYVTFRILLDPVNLNASATAKILQDYIDKYRKDEKEEWKDNEGQDISIENLQLVELVKNFKKLTENRLHYNKTGYLKAAKAEDLAQKNAQLTFHPKISELSQAIDKYHTQRFIEHNTAVEKKERSASPQQATMKENLDGLLFDLKGMQATFQGKAENNARGGNYGNESMLSRDRESALNVSKRHNVDAIDNRVQVIYKKHEVAEKRKDEQRKQRKLEDMKECTFQPLIKNYKYQGHRDVNETVNRLYNHHIVKKKKEEERIMEQIEKETREMEECTFKPDINNQAGAGGPKDLPKGFEKNVIRMRYATDEAKKKKEALEKISKGENYEKLKKARIKPFSFLENQKHKRDPPFVYIEINVAPGRTGRIGIHEDDDPRILAKNFAVAFQITEDMERNLEEIVTQQLQDHFAKKEQENMA